MATRNKRVPIPLPIRGLNTVEQFNSDIGSGYARELTNYYIKDGYLRVRPAVRSAAYTSGAGTVAWFDPSTSGSGFIALRSNGDKITVSTGAVITAAFYAGQTQLATTVKHSGPTGSLDLVIGMSEPRLAASPFTIAGPTTFSFLTAAVACACSHRGRLYYANSGTIVDYGTPGQIAGAFANTIDFAQFMAGQSILRMFSLTVNPNTSTENVFAIFGDLGRVLFFAGDHPAAANWTLISAFDMPQPGSRITFAEVDGDIFVGTTDYAYWARDLIQGGAQTAYENSPTRPIENAWKSVLWYFGSTTNPEVSYCKYLKNLDVVLCSCFEKQPGGTSFPYFAEYGSEAVIFAYHKKYKAWTLWGIAPFFWPVFDVGTSTISAYGTSYRKEVTALTPGSIVDQNGTSGSLVDISIETSWKTPYFAAFEGVGNKVNSVRVWFENTISGYFEKVRAIFDYSDYNVSLGWYTQSTVTQVSPANYGDGKEDGANQASNQYHPIIGASGAGGGVSFQFTQKAKSGSSTTQNQSIYAATAYIEEAGELW